MRIKSLENRSFLLLVGLVSLAFLWTLQGFLLPVFWAVVLTILFTPLYRRLERAFGGRGALASLATLLLIFLLLVVPITLVGLAVTSEAVGVYGRVSSGEIDVSGQIAQVEAMLPRLTRQAESLGIDLDRIRAGAGTAALSLSRNLASRLLTAGQSVFTFLLLLVVSFYTLFFFLKDRHKLMHGVIRALPLGDDRERRIFKRFASVTRATVKGTFIVAIVQGALGGVAFASLGLGSPILWGVVMALMSLVPAVGAAIVWIPAAAFLFATGEPGKGAIMVAIGGGVISMVDNFLRPILVGQDAGMPDYVILLSTLGGIAAFGVSGIVIGPVVAGLFLTVWEIFAEEFGQRDAAAPQIEMAQPDPAVGPPPAPSGSAVPADASGAAAGTA